MPRATAAAAAAPWFFDTAEQRLAWARQRFFDDGVRPTGLLSEAVLQSWTRCLQARQDPQRLPEFNPVSAGRVRQLLARHRPLLQAAGPELAQLQQALAGTPVVALLLNADGVVLHSSRSPDAAQAPLLARAARLGVALSEACIGTNAPALAARGHGPCLVPGAAHFASAIQAVHCAAAAIHGPDGRVAAVLDLSTEGRAFGFDATTVVAWYATAIENQLLLADASLPLVLRLHLQPAQQDSALVGLLGVQADGRIVWRNAAAAAVLGPVPAGSPVEALLGLPLAGLEQRARRGSMQALRLPNGLQVWLQGEWRGPAAAQPLAPPPPSAASVPPAPDTPAACSKGSTLRDSHRALVQDTLRSCAGNVSAAARALGVSRGLVYRHRLLPPGD